MLPLPEADLQQILDYASTLSKQDAADHFNNLLGESPQSIEFISSFNSHRQDQKHALSATESSTSEVPKPVRKQPKKKTRLHTPPPRQIQDTYVAQGHAYTKQDEEDYMAKKPANSFVLQSQPTVTQPPVSRTPPSAAGHLISDLKPTSRSAPASRTSSPAPKTKVNITGGTPMHGASTALTALDSAIRSLELQTNPSIKDISARRCDCNASRHPLLAAAPNCLNCGKIICVKEGLGPCTFCRRPLLSPTEIQAMIRTLREERGREKMALDASAHRKADISRTPAPFSAPRSGGPTHGEAGLGLSAAEVAMRKAQEHRDRLLGFQAQNAKRTTVRDEAAEFETPDVGTSAWASPAERARQLKAQQKVLRELEWNAQPEYEKRKQVLSLDLVGGKVIKRIGLVQRDRDSDGDDDMGGDGVDGSVLAETTGNADRGHGKGTFSHNPLLGALIKPVYDSGKGKEVDISDGERKKKTWRRVQDDYDDNEEIILDGGAFGGRDALDRRLGKEEYGFGS
jgi:hypothetical protein